MTKTHSSVLVLAGLDPTGGAGIQADIETLSSLQVHALPIVTCLTVQDTDNVKQLQSVDAQLIQQQIDTVCSDINIKGIKLGLLASTTVINTISKVLQQSNKIPIVVDPVLKAGGGTELKEKNTSANSIIESYRENIIPYSTVITPNSIEARSLTGKQNLEECAEDLLQLGCKHVLITGEHEKNADTIVNVLYSEGKKHQFSWPRLPKHYHGSGCTLASALTAYLVKNNSIIEASKLAQTYTDHALQNAIQLGKGQLHPNRITK